MLNNKMRKFLHCMVCSCCLWYVGISCIQGGVGAMFTCCELGCDCGDGCVRRHAHIQSQHL